MAEASHRSPTNADEYNAAFHANNRITGNGIEGTTMHVPCPFCAAPEWLVYRVIDSEQAMAAGATCTACGRTAKFLFAISPLTGHAGHAQRSISFRLVQCGAGDNPPAWLPGPPIERIP